MASYLAGKVWPDRVEAILLDVLRAVAFGDPSWASVVGADEPRDARGCGCEVCLFILDASNPRHHGMSSMTRAVELTPPSLVLDHDDPWREGA
jgi:hypothetical protein